MNNYSVKIDSGEVLKANPFTINIDGSEYQALGFTLETCLGPLKGMEIQCGSDITPVLNKLNCKMNVCYEQTAAGVIIWSE